MIPVLPLVIPPSSTLTPGSPSPLPSFFSPPSPTTSSLLFSLLWFCLPLYVYLSLPSSPSSTSPTHLSLLYLSLPSSSPPPLPPVFLSSTSPSRLPPIPPQDDIVEVYLDYGKVCIPDTLRLSMLAKEVLEPVQWALSRVLDPGVGHRDSVFGRNSPDIPKSLELQVQTSLPNQGQNPALTS